MAKFEKRTTAPSESNKYYLSTTVGGYNRCITIKSNGSCIPNCVGYCWGRALEAWGMTNCNLSRNNAESWFGNNDGYKRGQTPKVGSILCWAKGKVGNSSDGCGHVAFIEEVKSDGTVITSESAYGGTRWYSKTRKAPYSIPGYTFQGFIYPPVEFEEPKVVDKFAGISDEELARRVWAGEFGTGQDRANALGNRYSAVQTLVNKGVGRDVKTTEQPKSEPKTYTVVRGDNLTKICKKYYGKYTNELGNKIVNANKSKYPKMTLNYIQTGWNLSIPE